MKYLFLFLAGTLLLHLSYGQFKTIAESAVFDEPEEGHAKLVLLRDGYSAFLFFDPKEGISLKLYDAQYHLRTEKEIHSKFDNSKYKSIDASFRDQGRPGIVYFSTG
jgi:hypothetical protein